MIDLVVFSLLALLVVRGWSRGFVRQAIDVATLIVGAALALRLAAPLGSLITATLGWSPHLARIVGGAVLFLGLSIAAGVAGGVIHRSLHHLPGTNLLNRGAGAALGALYATVLVIVVLSLLAALPLPSAMASAMERSKVAKRVVDPDGPAQHLVGAVSGDRAMQSMIWLQRVVGDWLLVGDGDQGVGLPGESSGLRPSVEGARTVAAAVNEARAAAGETPLTWVDEMSVSAVARAGVIYRDGSFTGDEPVPGVEERLVLAPTMATAAQAVDGAGPYRAGGIGVVDGPYGVLVVVLLEA